MTDAIPKWPIALEVFRSEDPKDNLSLSVNSGDIFYIVGPNGSGKSALMSSLIKQVPSQKFKHLPAHRQTWMQASASEVAPSQRVEYGMQISRLAMQPTARYQDSYGNQKIAIVLAGLVSAQNAWGRKLASECTASNKSPLQYELENPAPLTKLSNVLALGLPSIQISISDEEQVIGKRVGGEWFGVEKLSDGERNAVLLSADVLIASVGTIFFIDEPERHLHRSVIIPLLSALFKVREDCAFLIATHEIALPTSDPKARTLLLRGCKWRGEEPTDWDIDVLEAGVDLPNDLKYAILGARSRILFVEGNAQSLDSRLYGILFPNVSIIPKGSCNDVIAATRGLSGASALHWLTAWGLIDRDGRSDRAAEDLKALCVYALSVHSVEGLYFSAVARQAMAAIQAKTLGRDAANLLIEAEKAVVAALGTEGTLEHLCAKRCEQMIRDEVLRQLPKAVDFLSKSVASGTFSPADKMEKEIKVFKELLVKRDIDQLISRYDVTESGALTQLAEALKFKSKDLYEDAVLAAARSDDKLR